LEEKVNEKIE
jgi:hypothetical protein